MAKQQINLSRQSNPSTLYSDSYLASGQAAAGEFVTTTRKTYNVSSIPTGHLFTVMVRNNAGDGAGLRNVNIAISYNGVGYTQDTMTQYHQSCSLTLTLAKVSGQNNVDIGFGGSAASQNWNSTLNQIN